MKFFALITFISALLLFNCKPFDQRIKQPTKVLPRTLEDQKFAFKSTFDHPLNANIAWSMISGEKVGIYPKTMRDFKDLEVGFLLSPTGFHLSALIALIIFVFKKFKNKKIFKFIKYGLLIGAFWLPYLAIKRIIIFRLLIFFRFYIKWKIPIEIMFFITFIISYVLGHFTDAPLGYILSFLYLGTFISLSDKPKIILLLGLFSSHLLVAFFSGNEVSFLSLIINLPILFLFSCFMPFLFLYFFTFKIIHFNWIEPMIQLFIQLIHFGAKMTHGSFLSSTFFLLAAVWILLLRKKNCYLLIALYLHGNVANTPTITNKSVSSQAVSVSKSRSY